MTFSFSENELIINEDGSYNLGLIKDIFSDWVSGNNQFENDVFNYKSSGGWGTLQEVFFVDPENLELYATTFNQEYNLKLFAKLSIGDAAFLEDMSAKNVVTEYDFLRRLNEISVRKIGTTSFIEIDQTVSSENANARAVNLLKKVGNDADVIFAYETAPGALDLEFGMGYTYDSIAYTSDSMLHVFHVSCLSKEHVLNDTDKYGVVSDTVTSIYEQNLEFYQDA